MNIIACNFELLVIIITNFISARLLVMVLLRYPNGDVRSRTLHISGLYLWIPDINKRIKVCTVLISSNFNIHNILIYAEA